MTWIDVKKELPPLNTIVLVNWLEYAIVRGEIVKGATVRLAFLSSIVDPPNWQEYTHGDFARDGDLAREGEVTHWQYRPDPAPIGK